MDHFGNRSVDISVPRENALNSLCEMAPGTLLRNMQKYDFQSSFHVTRKGEFTGAEWKNRSENGRNLSVLSGTVTASEIVENQIWSILFKNGILFNKDIAFAENTPQTSGFTSIIFRSVSDQRQTLLSSWNSEAESFNEITLTGTEVVLKFGDSTEEIQHSTKSWTALWITWRSDATKTYWFWQIDKLSGHFTSEAGYLLEDGLSLGGRRDSTSHFHGEVLGFDIYNRQDEDLKVPQKLRNLIIATGIEDD